MDSKSRSRTQPNSNLEPQASKPTEVQRARAVLSRYGILQASAKGLKYLGLKAAGRSKYWMYRNRYPTSLVFIASLAKSGSTWLANMIADLPGFQQYQPAAWTTSLMTIPNQDIYPGLFHEVERRLAVVKGHTPGTLANAALLRNSGHRYLLTVRDPRDQIISGYWYLRNHPRHRAHAAAMELTLEEFITRELDPQYAQIDRSGWLRAWLTNRDPDRSLLVRYEDLLDNADSELMRIFGFFGFEVEPPRIARIVENHTFTRRSGRSRGEEDTGNFLRRGIAGEWRSVFTDQHRTRVEAVMEDLIEELGYQPTFSEPRR